MTITVQTPPLPAPSSADPFADTKCGACIGLCCRYFALEIDTPDEPSDFENLRWYMLHERVQIFVDDDDWYLQIYSKCTMLGDDHKCMDYENRPQICRDYTDESCDYDGPQGEVFHNIAELDAFRDKWVAEYEAGEKRRADKAKRRKGKKKKRR